MARSRVAIGLAVLFLVLFFLSGVTASMTIDDTTATVGVSMGAVLFSLSSVSVLLLPLSVVAMVIAVIGLVNRQRSVGMLFAAISAVCLGVFLFTYAREKMNNSLYDLLSAEMKALGIKFKKRDVSGIDVQYSPLVYLAVCVGVLTAIVAAPPLKTQHDRYLMRRSLLPYAFIGPHLFFFIIFFIVPAVYGIYAAFTKWDLFTDPVWIGLDNFRTILFDSNTTYYRQLRNGLGNTVKFVIMCVPLSLLVPLLLALALQTKPRGGKIFQALYYLPALMSISTVTIAWRYFFWPSYGAMNNFFMSSIEWFAQPYFWTMIVIITVWWMNGGTMVIYQSSLASVPSEHYEAASVDGASALHKFWYITLPGMRYPLSYTLITAVVAQFNIYGQPLMLNQLRANEANYVLLMYVYENAVKTQVAGISAAMALVLGACIMVVSLIQLRVMRLNAPE